MKVEKSSFLLLFFCFGKKSKRRNIGLIFLFVIATKKKEKSLARGSKGDEIVLPVFNKKLDLASSIEGGMRRVKIFYDLE